MRYQISAMGFGELLDMAFRLMCQRFFLLLAIQVFVLLPVLAGLIFYGASAQSAQLHVEGAVVGAAVGAALILGGTAILLQMVGVAAITRVVAALYQGERTGFADALGTGLRVAFPLLGTILLFMVLFGVAAAVAMTVASAFPGFLALLFLLGLALLGVYFFLPLTLLAPVAVLERTYFVAGLSRCSELMDGHRGRIFAVLLVVGIASFVMQIPLAMVGELPGIAPVAQVLSQAIAGAFGGTLAVLFYFDLRCRKEGYDLDQLTLAVADRTAVR